MKQKTNLELWLTIEKIIKLLHYQQKQIKQLRRKIK